MIDQSEKVKQENLKDKKKKSKSKKKNKSEAIIEEISESDNLDSAIDLNHVNEILIANDGNFFSESFEGFPPSTLIDLENDDKLCALPTSTDEGIIYVNYVDESLLPKMQALVAKDLSEPYSIFTYRYFLHNWPKLCICVFALNENGDFGDMIATIICKAEIEQNFARGYIAMLAVSDAYRNKGIGSKLANLGIHRMIAMGCEEIVLETEVTNLGALGLYEKLGFVRDERLSRYYLNGGDAFRLKLWVDKRDSILEKRNTP